MYPSPKNSGHLVKVISGQNHFWYYKVRLLSLFLRKKMRFSHFYAIKAIPTLHGEDAIRFREEMEANEKAFLSRTKRDRNKDPFVIKNKAAIDLSAAG